MGDLAPNLVEVEAVQPTMEVTISSRSSSRLTGKKRPYYGTPEKKASHTASSKPPPPEKKPKTKAVNQQKPAKKDLVKLREVEEASSAPSITECSELVEDGLVMEEAVVAVGESNSHQRVKETIRLFTKHYLHYIQVYNFLSISN